MMGGADPDDGKEEERSDESFEPAFFHHLPESLYSDALGAYEIRGCLDLTPGCGDLARACLLRRIPYLGLGMSDLHCSLLKAQLVEYVKMLMRSEGSTFYSPEWAAAASEAKGDEKDNKKRAADSNAKPEPVKPAKKPKPAKKTKKDKKNDEELVEDTDSASEWVDLLRLLNWPIWVAAGVSLRPFRRFWQDFKFHWLISSHFWLGQFDLAI